MIESRWERVRALEKVSIALIFVYSFFGIFMMAIAPRVPYADAWRFLANFLIRGFPRDVLTPDNGHHELIPNVIRVTELHLLHANQLLQITSGIGFLLAALWIGWRIIRELPTSAARVAGMLALVLGLLWLGNERALSHANETVHAYSIVFFMMLGMSFLMVDRPSPWRLIGASLCGLMSAFCFGSGIAVFAAFAAVLFFGRGDIKSWLILFSGAGLTLWLLHLTGSSSGALIFAPGRQLYAFVSWLSGPAIYVGWPVLDPPVSNNLPGRLQFIGGLMGQMYQAAFGSVMLPQLPQLCLGALGIAWYGTEVWRAWRRPTPVSRMGVGLASFSLAVAGLIAIVRYPYFLAHPDQLLAPRYIVWSSLFWCGLLVAMIGRSRAWSRGPQVVLLFALILLPSELWMWRLADGMRITAERNAVAATMGIVDGTEGHGESQPGDIAKALPLLKAEGAAMFALPEARLLGQALVDGTHVRVATRDEEVVPVENLIGPTGRKIVFSAKVDQDRLLLVDPDGVVRGIAMRDATKRRNHWVGWMSGQAPLGPPTVFALSDN